MYVYLNKYDKNLHIIKFHISYIFNQLFIFNRITLSINALYQLTSRSLDKYKKPTKISEIDATIIPKTLHTNCGDLETLRSNDFEFFFFIKVLAMNGPLIFNASES